MSLARSALTGIFPALPTPIDASGNVDKKAVASLVDFLIAGGATGLVPVGGTGEYAALSPRDRQEMVAATVAAAKGRVPVVAGVLSTGFKESVQAGRDFVAAGAVGLMLVTPYYVTATQEGIREYFKAYADSLGVPILLYEIPYRTGISLKAETIQGMVEDGSIVGMKACNPDLSQFIRLIQLVGDKIAIMSGEEPLFATHVALGATGGVLATANLFPRLLNDIFDSARAGNLKAAIAKQKDLYPLLQVLFSETNPGPLKQAMAMIGLNMGPVLRPLQAPRADTMEALRQIVPALARSEQQLSQAA